MEAQIRVVEAALSAAKDPDVSVSSANPNQIVWNPMGNTIERNKIHESHLLAVKRLSARTAYLYGYASETFYRLRLSGIADDVFTRNRNRADGLIAALAPDSVQKFVAVHDNLASDNPEDWANAVHSCRRILQDIADIVFPETEPQERGGKKIKLGPDNYINRLVSFVEDNRKSDTFLGVVGSHLRFIGDRLDAVFGAAQKGSHSTVSREEAERYVIYTYLLAGDILTLRKEI